MTTMRVLLTLDLIAAEDPGRVPGILRDVWDETPAALPEVAASLPALYQAKSADTASRRGVVALSLAEQHTLVPRPDQPGKSVPEYRVSVTSALTIDPVEGANFTHEKIKDDAERFARYVFHLDEGKHDGPAPTIAGCRITGVKADIENEL
jgi:hypothetical protein